MKVLDRELFVERAWRKGQKTVDCLTNDCRSADAVIVHEAGKVFVRLAYWRSGRLHEHFLEIAD